MKTLIRKYKYHMQAIGMLIAMAICSVIFLSCEKEELDIQQNFPFEVKVMPVPKEITPKQTVEIRITIESNGKFTDTEYFIRYFQFDGAGSLRYYNEKPYRPNDLYPLADTEFRLYYTSRSSVSQAFDIWISDNFGNEEKLSFQFNSRDNLKTIDIGNLSVR